MSTATLDYPFIRNLPVACFRYKGSHSKPVRREVVLTDITRKHFTGYEVREGNTTRSIDNAEIKTFDRTKVEDLVRMSIVESGIEV